MGYPLTACGAPLFAEMTIGRQTKAILKWNWEIVQILIAKAVSRKTHGSEARHTFKYCFHLSLQNKASAIIYVHEQMNKMNFLSPKKSGTLAKLLFALIESNQRQKGKFVQFKIRPFDEWKGRLQETTVNGNSNYERIELKSSRKL